ncbi:MAG: MATE family efflux transporter [Eubacteriales bacterium]|nr:MATE family efflux transporter [Eubacteriales bacterium]
MVKDKSFYRTLIALSLPIILQNFISLGVNLVDNLMLGRYSEAALSGVTAVNQIQFVYQNISIWGIVIPVSFAAAFVLHASPFIVVCCLNMDQIFKCVPAFIKVNYGNWYKKLTR